MLEQFSATIDKIYATAGDFQRWHDALQAIEALTGSAGAVIDMVPRSTTFAAKTIAGSFGLTECATYARDYMAICPRIRFALEHPQGPHYDHLLLTEAEMDRDPVYAWFGSYGLRYYIGAWAGQTPNYRATFSLQRSRKQGHATEADMAMFNLLKPHAARALSLADQLGTLHSRERVGSSLVESLTQAVLAIARDGRIVHANDAAMRVLGTGDGLLVSKGFLRTQIPDEQARLDQLIREAIDVEILATSGWCKASRVSGALPYAIFVAPLHTDDETFLDPRQVG